MRVSFISQEHLPLFRDNGVCARGPVLWLKASANIALTFSLIFLIKISVLALFDLLVCLRYAWHVKFHKPLLRHGFVPGKAGFLHHFP